MLERKETFYCHYISIIIDVKHSHIKNQCNVKFDNVAFSSLCKWGQNQNYFAISVWQRRKNTHSNKIKTIGTNLIIIWKDW
jgi:hypothetical protein